MPRPPGSQPLFERARKRVTQRLSLAGLNSSGPGSAKLKIPAAVAVAAPPPTMQMTPMPDVALEMPASVVVPLLPEAVLLADPASLLQSPQGQGDFRLPMGAVLPMLPSGKIEFTIADLAQCAPEGLIHPVDSLGEYGAMTILLPLPQVVMRIPADYMKLRRDQKQIDQAVASMNDPFSPEAIRAKVEAAQAAQAAQQAELEAAAASETPFAGAELSPSENPGEIADPGLSMADQEPDPEPVMSDTALQTEAVDASEPDTGGLDPALAALAALAESEVQQADEALPIVENPVDAPVVEESADPADSFSFTQSSEYQALLSKLQVPELPVDEPSAVEVSTPPPSPNPIKTAPVFSFAQRAKVKPVEPTADESDVEPLPASPLSAAVASSPQLADSFSKALKATPTKTNVPTKAASSELHQLIRLPADVPAGFKEFTRQISLWPGMLGCILCGPDGLPISAAGGENKTDEALAAVAPRLFKTTSGLLTDLGRAELSEMNLPGKENSLTLFRDHGFILVLVHEDEQLPIVHRKTIHAALALLAQSGPG
ncbi:MAG: roadblock/LC7 domain-containing protein [Candidatus Methylacidiphilales bacterium]|nr:roadblock/LC7 domain-containing protein [Candidatus Methylacidiphilales bacterium]